MHENPFVCREESQIGTTPAPWPIPRLAVSFFQLSLFILFSAAWSTTHSHTHAAQGHDEKTNKITKHSF